MRKSDIVWESVRRDKKSRNEYYYDDNVTDRKVGLYLGTWENLET